VVFAFRDEFTTPESAPLTSPRTAEPGPGTLTITDSGNTLDISGGQIVPNAGSIGIRDPWIRNAAGITRAAGYGLFMKIAKSSTGTSHNSPTVGFANTLTTPDIAQNYGFFFHTTGVYSVTNNNAAAPANVLMGSYTLDTLDDIAVVLRSLGFFMIVGNEILWPSVIGNEATLYPHVSARDAGRRFAIIDSWRNGQLAAPWTTDNGIATQVLSGARAPADTFIHEGNAFVEFTVTALTTTTVMQVSFREQDASNYWYVEINAAGDLILNEVIATVPNVRQTALAAVGAGDRVVIEMNGASIMAYVDRALAWTHGTATNFQTETDGGLLADGDGTISDIISWPKTLSGTALRELNKFR
jgi:hypothetical protein